MRLLFLLLFSSFYHTDTQAQGFPASFVGNWKGTIQWMVAGKPMQSFTMQLRVHATDTAGVYTWQMIYGDKEQDNRPYLLKPVDTAKGHWVIDERDGIILDSYLHGTSFLGAFTVQGTTIVDNYSLMPDGGLQVEFFTIKLSEKKTSGKGTEDIPFIDSYRVAGYQTGVLHKME